MVLAVGMMAALSKPGKTFLNTTPFLASRVEYQMSTGVDFNASESNSRNEWKKPSPAYAPASQF